MDLFDKSYYKMIKILMSILGQWPLQSVRKRNIIRTLVALATLSIVIPEIIEFINELNNLATIFECIPPLGLHVMNAFKYITCGFHMDKLLKLMKYMEKDWMSRVNKDDSKILTKYAERGRVIASGYAYYMFIGGVFYICAPLLPLMLDVIQPLDAPRPREFLFRTEYYIDQDKYFIPIFIHAFLTTALSMITVVGCDTMFGAYVHYACALFAELSEKLESPVKNKDKSIYVKKNDDEVYHHIVKCVKKHKEAIKFFDLMESTYAMYSLFVIGMNIILISFTGVQTIMRVEDAHLVTRYSCYTFGQVMHAFYGCWHGQLLRDHSEAITMAAYKSDWYNSSFRSRKLLTLMMTRSMKPCQLTAGKLFFVSLGTFTTIIKTAMSYFTVLRSLQ